MAAQATRASRWAQPTADTSGDDMRLAEVQKVLDGIAPPANAEPWDNVGLLLGTADQPVSQRAGPDHGHAEQLFGHGAETWASGYSYSTLNHLSW